MSFGDSFDREFEEFEAKFKKQNIFHKSKEKDFFNQNFSEKSHERGIVEGNSSSDFSEVFPFIAGFIFYLILPLCCYLCYRICKNRRHQNALHAGQLKVLGEFRFV